MALPNDPVAISGAMDPSEILDFVFDFANLLQDSEVIDPDQVTLTMSAEGTALGITIATDADREAALIDSDTAILLWLSVDAAFRSNAAFAGAGTTVGVEAHVRTNALPYRELERTFTITIRQR